MIDIRHWLLDAAVELTIPLRIVGAPNAGEILNRKGPGLNRSDLAICLEELMLRGEIETLMHANGETVHRRLCNAEIREALAEDRWSRSESWSYGLTARGGAEWERWARPQWSRYNRTCSWKNFQMIGAATEGVARQLLELEEYILCDCAIIQESIRRRAFRNWRATYWKTLPDGHLIAFRTRPLPEEQRIAAPDAKWAQWLELDEFYSRPPDCGF